MLIREPTHLALFYGAEEAYVEGVLAFAAGAVEAGDPLAVAVPGGKGKLLEGHLRELGAEPEIFDMVELGHNPARIIPAVEAMRSRHQGRRLHYVGEPIWAGRTPEEIREATRHEALINLAWPQTDIRMLCPYDELGLDAAVLEDARRTHPHLIKAGRTSASPDFHGPLVPAASEHPLSQPPADAAVLPFGLQNLGRARALVGARAAGAGLEADHVSDLVLAINELMTNAIRHAGGHGVLSMWATASSMVCQIEDAGHITDPLAGRRAPVSDRPGGVGLWAANQLCDLVEIRSGAGGTTVRAHFALA